MIATEQKGTITRLSSVIIREHAAPIQEIEEINAIYSRSDFRK